MRIHELLLFVALSLFLCPSLHAQSDFDGDFWIPRAQDAKLMYVMGFVDGRNDGINDLADAFRGNDC
jgi:hypothetical protein